MDVESIFRSSKLLLSAIGFIKFDELKKFR